MATKATEQRDDTNDAKTQHTAGSAESTKRPDPPVVPMGHLVLLESASLRWRCNLPRGITPEMLADPVTWSVVRAKLSICDTIEAVGHGGTYWAELLVTQAGRDAPRVEVQVLRVVPLPQVDPHARRELPPGHQIVFDAQTGTYRGYRGEVPMTAPHPRLEDAHREMLDHATLREGVQ